MGLLQDVVTNQPAKEVKGFTSNLGSTKMDSILICLDGSLAAQSAAHLAIRMAQSLQLSVYGIYIADLMVFLGGKYGNPFAELYGNEVPHSEPEAIGLFEKQGKLALKWLEDMCRYAQAPVKTDFFLGGVPELIQSKANEVAIVSLGKRGNGHPDDPQRLGSNFVSTIHHIQRPILVAGESPTSLKNLLVIADGSEGNNDVFTWVARLQTYNVCEVSVLSINGNNNAPQSPMRAVMEQLETCNLRVRQFVSCNGNLPDLILETAGQLEADLIVLGKNQPATQPDGMEIGVVETLLRQSPLPVFII